jgi:hypothetical protein
MKRLFAILALALPLSAQNVQLTKTPATPAGSTANNLTPSSKVIVVPDGGSISAMGTGQIISTSGAASTLPWSGLTAVPSPTLTLTGDATGSVTFSASGGVSTALTLPNINSNVGSFAGITVNAKGQVTGASSLTIATTAPLTGGGTLGNLTLSMPAASGSTNGYLTSGDWTLFNSKDAVVTFAAPIVRTGNNVAIPAATGSVNGYLTSADWTTFNAKQTAGSYITALTGDVTAAGPGSSAATLASVATPGTTGSSTAIPVITIDAKGRTTAATTAAVIAPAGTLTGTTLAPNVVTSSLTSGAGGSFGSLAYLSAAPAGTLTGTNLAPNVVTSSLTGAAGGSFGSLAFLSAAPAGTLTGTTLAPNVVGSSLTSAAGGAFGSLAYLSAAPAGTVTGTTLASNVVTSSLTSAAGGAFGSLAYLSAAPAGTLTGTTLASNVVTSSLTSVGTIASGTWNGSVLAGQYGGTGVANTGKTITLGGNYTSGGAVTWSGAYGFTGTLTGTTAVTFPTSGPLANAAAPLRALQAKLGTIANGTAARANIVLIGDSISADLIFPTFRSWQNAYGYGGMMGGAAQFNVVRSDSSGVGSAVDYSQWIAGGYSTVPAAETITWYPYQGTVAGAGGVTLNSIDPQITRIKVYYLRYSGGGTFKLQTSSNGGGSYTDVGGYTSIDTNNSTNDLVCLTATVSAANYRMRIVGVSGTCRIVNVGYETTSGVVFNLAASAGGTTFHDYASTPSAVWASFLTDAAPDLIIVMGKDDADSLLVSALATITTRITASAPNATVIFVGPYESQTDDGVAAAAIFRAAADSAGQPYWYAGQYVGSWVTANAIGMFTDGVHLNDAGRYVLAENFDRDFGLLTAIRANNIGDLGSATQIARMGAFPITGGTITGVVSISDATAASGGGQTFASKIGALTVAGGVAIQGAVIADGGFAIGTDIGNKKVNFVSTALTTSSTDTNPFVITTTMTDSQSGGSSTSLKAFTVVGTYTKSGSGNNTSFTQNILNIAGTFSGSGSATLIGANGSYLSVEHSGSYTIAEFAGSNVQMSIDGTGNTTSAWGYRLGFNKTNSGVVGTAYAYSAPAMSFATTNYAFHSAGAGLWLDSDTTEATSVTAAFKTLGGILSTKKLITLSTLTTAAGVTYDLGAVNTVSPTSPNRTVTMSIGGTTYYLAAKTTDD